MLESNVPLQCLITDNTPYLVIVNALLCLTFYLYIHYCIDLISWPPQEGITPYGLLVVWFRQTVLVVTLFISAPYVLTTVMNVAYRIVPLVVCG